MAKESLAKVLESATEAMSTAKTTITAKAVRKEKKEGRKAKEKDKEKTRNQLQTRVSKATACGKWGHKASECWQGYVQAVEEIPSSSASSVAPSAGTTPAAAKTAASIQEFNDDQELMGGSVASVTTGTDDLWDELVLDSGSVSTACPCAWCSDISVNNEDKVYLQDIQQRRIPSHGSRVVPLELWCPEGSVECKVEFDVTYVAYPVVSLGNVIESVSTFSFDDYKCFMHKGNQRVEIFRKGRIFVLRMRRRWLESNVQMVAPIEEVAAEEIEIDEDGEGAGVARAEPRADEPGDEPPPPRPREVRPSAIRPGAEIVRLHNVHIRAGQKCVWHRKAEVITIIVKRHSRWTETLRGYRWISCSLVQKEHSWMNRERETVLMVICKDDGNLSPTEVRSKTDEYGVELVLRFLSTYESVEIKTDGEPSIVEIARRVQARRDKTTTLAQTSVGGHKEIGAVERANGTVQAQLRTYYLDVQDRMKVRIIPGTQLFPWMLRHSVWTVVRYQSHQRTKQTPYERTRGCRYESALVPFGEVVMAKIADADKMRAGKLDSAWVKAVCVGRVDRSNKH